MKSEKELFPKNLLLRDFIPAFKANMQRCFTHHASRIAFHVSTDHLQLTNFRLSLVVILICFSLLSCGVKAPEDYYLRLLAMEKAGEQERSDTGRKIGEIVIPEESLEPMTIALQAENALSSSGKPLNSDLIKIIHINRPKIEGANASSSSPLIQGTASKPTPSAVPISINKEILEESLQDEGIKVIGIITKNGRLDGEKNLVQVHFVSDTRSDDAIYEKFLYICAIVYGHDMGKNRKAKPSVNEVNTVDAIMGFAIVEDFPYMVLESQMADYVDFVNKKILYRDWISKLLIKKLEP